MVPAARTNKNAWTLQHGHQLVQCAYTTWTKWSFLILPHSIVYDFMPAKGSKRFNWLWAGSDEGRTEQTWYDIPFPISYKRLCQIPSFCCKKALVGVLTFSTRTSHIWNGDTSHRQASKWGAARGGTKTICTSGAFIKTICNKLCFMRCECIKHCFEVPESNNGVWVTRTQCASININMGSKPRYQNGAN